MIEQIEGLLLEKFKEEGYEDFFIVDIKFNAANKKLEVFIDSDTGVSIGKCAKINRYLQHHIDEAGWLGEKYVLDVSSPGIDQPLKFLRQYKKNVGRKVKVKLLDKSEHKGTLTEVGENSITIAYKVRMKEGKRKKTIEEEQEIAFDNIEKTIVQISFKK